ncbi:DUF3515 family protein [Streptomyces palmae]|uniref:DUF3515 family protein n=1 Tax=Streptomyces palmae TaxID=1701085 RepID=A0A4Z0FYQ3_9ACTN|nr:DUF3515 family protein [Streptomyces palmae]TGA87558.1 DUF3515 family protein [Streptomyces palmae]
MARRFRGRHAAIGAAVAVLVAGGVLIVRETTSSEPGIQAAPQGDHPRCARIAARYPSVLAGQRQEPGKGPGVAVWGDEAVVLRCGLRAPDPTPEPCVNVDGVDWVVEEARSQGGKKFVITYGRHPAVEVAISDRLTGIDEVLVELSHSVKPIRQQEECIN